MKETTACFGPSLDYCVVKINKNALLHLGPVVHHRLIRPLNLPACALAFLPCRHHSYSRPHKRNQERDYLEKGHSLGSTQKE